MVFLWAINYSMVRSIIFFAFLFSTVLLSAQEKSSVKGRISDANMNDEALHFAQVSLKGASRSTHTNLHGNFELQNVDPGTYTLVISFPGYRTKEVSLAIDKSREVYLSERLQPLTVSVDQVLRESIATDHSLSSENTISGGK